jgi:2,4-dienoyl-CoA reductase-like NADH-dependent reductase (Old Yellow Enzyme family)
MVQEFAFVPQGCLQHRLRADRRSMTTFPGTSATLASALTLPSGLRLENRMAKAATSECLATLDHRPTAALARLYGRFARGGAALLITGNVMVDARFLERPANVVLESEQHLASFVRWAAAANAHRTPLLMQLNHAGRQCNRMITSQPLGPSAGPAVRVLSGYARPRALEVEEIRDIIARFVRAAQVARRAGFAGVQIDAAHGYLLSQFLSPRTNRRGDAWGGSLANRARLLRETVQAVRAATARDFTVAVKLNSADFQRGGFEEGEALEVVRWLAQDAIDLLEISGGTYEVPALLGLTDSTRAREAYFLDFARRVRAVSALPLMVTGGFRTRAVMESALAEGALDLIGLARPLLLEPDLPNQLLAGRRTRARAQPLAGLPRALTAVGEAAYYDAQIRRLARGRRPLSELSLYLALLAYFGGDLWRALARVVRRAAVRRMRRTLERARA